MEKIIINENERGFLFKNGKYIKMLTAGKYRIFSNSEIEVVSTDDELKVVTCGIETLLNDKAVADTVSVAEVGDRELYLHFVNGKFVNALTSGRYVFWKCGDKHEYIVADISEPEVSADIPEYIFSKLPASLYTKIEVSEYQKARLYFNQKFIRVLDAGTYYFWKNSVKIEAGFIDTRLTSMDITGQEILTQDKVSLRINFVCNYRVTDYVKILTEINNFTEHIHLAAQLALREYVGKYRLDEILENKDKISEYVFEKLKAKEKELYVEIVDAGVKDIILPGEIRAIMNTVLIAEKRA